MKIVAVVALAMASSVHAQQHTGAIVGRVTDDQEQPQTGAALTLTGSGLTLTRHTDGAGNFQILRLAPGTYRLEVSHPGFQTAVFVDVPIEVGRSVVLEVALNAGDPSVAELREANLLHPRTVLPGTSLGLTELQRVPTARDPWALVPQTPGVLADRINVGGNESGQQATFTSPGTNDDNSVWVVDGVTITDMGAIGSSPTYYHFDFFQAAGITIGGNDPTTATAGTTLNLVTRRGGENWRGSVAYLVADEGWQSDLDVDDSDLPESQRSFLQAQGLEYSQGNRIEQLEDYRVEVGGPLIRNRLWIWGAYGEQEIALRTARTPLSPDGEADDTELENYALKLNAELSRRNSFVAFYHYGDKIKVARNASPQRPAPTTWNQDGPTDIWKMEDTHIFSSNFYLTGMASYVGGGFQLVPQGGGIGDPNFPNVVRDPDVIWQNSFLIYQTDRPQEQYRLDGNYFFNTGAASHELRFGVGYRTADVDSFSTWPGQQLVGLADIAFAPGVYLGWSRTDRNVSDTANYTSAYVQDTLTFGNFTANLGLRYDLQDGEQNPSTIPPAPVSQGILLGGTFPGGDPGFEWESITPRLGLTYALGEERDTLLRLSYSRFADQLSSGNVSYTNPTNYQYGYFIWYDDNNDLVLTGDEAGDFFSFAGALDPRQPGQLSSPNRADPALDAPLTEEFVASVEHSLLPEFIIGASVTWRNYHDILEGERLVCDGECAVGFVNARPHRADDYVLTTPTTGTLPDGTAFSLPRWTFRDGVVYSGGNILENGDREQDYLGVSLTFNKRLANRWLLRGHFTWSDWTWNVPSSEREDPTVTLGDLPDGEIVYLGSGGTSGNKGGIYINSTWAFDVSGLYQIAPDRPWGFNVAANINGREGYAIPWAHNRNVQDGIGTRSQLAAPHADSFRHDDVIIFNGRVEKEFTFSDFGLTLSIDGFNLLNESYVLQRQLNLNAGSGNFVTEVVSPRIFRIGARLNFR